MPMPPNAKLNSCVPRELAEGVRGPPTRQQQDRKNPVTEKKTAFGAGPFVALIPPALLLLRLLILFA